MDTTSSGMSSLMNPLSSPPSCNNNPKIHKRSVSVTSITSTVLPPVYNQQNEDTCIIRISVEDNNGNMYKSIMVRHPDPHPHASAFAQSEYAPRSPWVDTSNGFIYMKRSYSFHILKFARTYSVWSVSLFSEQSTWISVEMYSRNDAAPAGLLGSLPGESHACLYHASSAVSCVLAHFSPFVLWNQTQFGE